MTWHRKSAEAEKYTTAMWQNFTSRLISVALSTDAQRRGFRDGFNGETWPHHWRVRESFDAGRHAAVLLGYLK